MAPTDIFCSMREIFRRRDAWIAPPFVDPLNPTIRDILFLLALARRKGAFIMKVSGIGKKPTEGSFLARRVWNRCGRDHGRSFTTFCTIGVVQNVVLSSIRNGPGANGVPRWSPDRKSPSDLPSSRAARLSGRRIDVILSGRWCASCVGIVRPRWVANQAIRQAADARR